MKKIIILGSNNDYFSYAFKNLIEMDNVEYIASELDTNSALLNAIYKVLNSSFADKFGVIQRLLYRLLFPFVLNKEKLSNNDGEILLLYFANRAKLINNGYINYMNNKIKNIKHVVYFQDLIQTYKNLDLDKLKNCVDALITYDKKDAITYSINYYPSVYSYDSKQSYVKFKDTNNRAIFIGKDKGRSEQISNLVNKLANCGIDSDVYILDSQSKKANENFVYLDKPISYKEYLGLIENYSYLIEILQEGADGTTLRTCESIIYDKKLITNNTKIAEEIYYNPSNMIVISKSNELEENNLTLPFREYLVEEKNGFSPRKLICYINELLH